MKFKKSPKILERIRAFFGLCRTHLPCRGGVPPVAGSTSSCCVWSHSNWRTDFGSSGSPSLPATVGPLNPPRQPDGAVIGMRAEESSERCLDVTWDVSVLYIFTKGKKTPHKPVDVLRSQVDEKRLWEGAHPDQFHLRDGVVDMDIQVFAAQTNDHPGHLGNISAPAQSGGSSSQNDDASGQPESSPSSGVACSDREQESSNQQSHTSAPPVAFPQLRQVLPDGQPLSGGPNWGSPPTHGFDDTITPHPYQGPSGGPGGRTMVMRLNPGAPRPGLQTDSDGTAANVSEGIGYGGGKHKFVCETCGQPFSSKYNVKRHQQSTSVHKGDRPGREEGFFCGQCGQKLSRPDALRRHERNKACGKRPGGSGQGGQGPPTALP